MDAEVLAWVAAALSVVRGVIAVIQKETVSLLTVVAVFLLAVAAAVGHLF